MLIYALTTDSRVTPLLAEEGPEETLRLGPIAAAMGYPLAPLRTVGDVVVHASTDPLLPYNPVGSVLVGQDVYGLVVLSGPGADDAGYRHHVLTETTAQQALDLIQAATEAVLQARVIPQRHNQHRA